MISRTIFCSAQAAVIRLARTGPMPVTSLQALRLGFDRVEHLLAERAYQLLGVDRADASDHPRPEIFFDPVERGRRRGLQEPGPELLAVGAIVDPFADAVIHSPAEIAAAWPTTVTSSR